MFILPELKPDEIIIYLRKSRTDDPALTVSETVAKHEQMLDEYSMRTWGAMIPEQNRFREIVSGETIEARPEIKKVLRLIEQDRFKAILIVEPQRLSRGDLEDIGKISKLLRYTRTYIITLQYSYDLTDERDRDYFERELKRGNEYLEYSKRILKNGIRASLESGYYIGSEPPYGYKKTRVKIGKRTYPTLIIDDHEAQAVRMIYQMYSDGCGASKIRNSLVSAGFTPKKAEYWSDNVIFRILDNPHYIGKIRYNYRTQNSIVQDGEIKKSRKPNKNPEIVDGFHPAIIDSELWEKVRAQRLARHVPAVHSTKILSYPLAGLVYCECGARMIQASKSKGRKRRIYCQHQAICGNSSAFLSDVMDAVYNSLTTYIPDISVHIDSLENKPNLNIDALKNRLSALIRKQDTLWEQLAEGMPRDTFDRLLPAVTADIETITAAIESAKYEEESRLSMNEIQISLHDAIQCMDNPDISAGEINRILKSCIRKITYHRRKGEDFRLDIEMKF